MSSQGNTVGYGYDNEGNVTTITYPGNKTVTYTYDGSNRLKTVTDWAARVTTYTYDATGRLDHVTRPNSTQQRVTFDDANRLTASYEEKLSGGNVVATLWKAGYGYDNANRLTSFTPTPMAQNNPPPTVTMTCDADNQLATYNGTAVGHDMDGNLLSAPVGSGTSVQLGALTWDKRNRLTSAGGITYTYDAENRRTRSTTTYIYSRGEKLDRLLAKTNPDGSVTRYVYGAGLLYEETTSAAGVAQSPIYYHYDWRGDTVALSDTSGNIIAQMSYTPYGVCTIDYVANGITVTTPFCFNGKWGVMTEPSGLLSMQARYYSTRYQRFLNEDPSGFEGGLNMYAYANGDPIDAMDPFGLGPLTKHDQERIDQFASPNVVTQRVNEGIKQFNNGSVPAVKEYFSDGPRYAYNQNLGWIDLQHVAASAAVSRTNGQNTGQFIGLMVEVSQALKGYVNPFTALGSEGAGYRESAFALEDLLSNAIGDNIGVKGPPSKSMMNLLNQTDARNRIISGH